MTTDDLLVLLRSRYKADYTEAINLIEKIKLSSQNRDGFPNNTINALREDLELFALYNEDGLASRGTIDLQRLILTYAKQKKSQKKIGIKFFVEDFEGNITSELMRDLFSIHNCIPILIQRAINQLLSNAYKYATPESEIKITRSVQGNLICIQNIGPFVNEEEICLLKERGYGGENADSVLGQGQGLWLAQKVIDIHTKNIAPISLTLYPERECRFILNTIPYANFTAQLCLDRCYFQEQNGDNYTRPIETDHEEMSFESYMHDLWELLKRLHGNIKKLTKQFNEIIPLKILLENLWMFTDLIEYIHVLLNGEDENYFFGDEILLNPEEVFKNQFDNLIKYKYPNFQYTVTGTLSKQITIPNGFYRLLSSFFCFLLNRFPVNGAKQLSVIFDINTIVVIFRNVVNGSLVGVLNLKHSLLDFKNIPLEDFDEYLLDLYLVFFEMIGCKIEVTDENLELKLPLE